MVFADITTRLIPASSPTVLRSIASHFEDLPPHQPYYIAQDVLKIPVVLLFNRGIRKIVEILMVSAEEQRREKQVQKPIQFVRGFFLLSHTLHKFLQ